MKKTVILADNSYTIRRIVELSFSEEEEIDLISFDTGLNLKEKIIEIKPAVVLVDIKLPEVDGYEICRFINETDELKETKVFLIKGGFEPVDEAQLKDLTYSDFITKPFDSKALVGMIKNILSGEQEEMQPTQEAEVPTSLPEDIPSIEGIEDIKDSIDFSDIDENIDTEKFFGDENVRDTENSINNDVLPSEEITQGATDEDVADKISPDFPDELDNPFAGDDSLVQSSNEIPEEELEIKENIRLQEEELNISSLTQEEINIQKEMDKLQPSSVEKKEVETSEQIKNVTEDLSVSPGMENINESQLENVFSPPEEKEIVQEPPLPQREETKKTIPDVTDQAEIINEDSHPVDRKEEIEKVLSEIKTKEEKSVEESGKSTGEITESKPETEQMRAPDTPSIPDTETIMNKVEDKLTQSVKEILWDIVPNLAEKLIKEEIKKIESQLDNELSPEDNKE